MIAIAIGAMLGSAIRYLLSNYNKIKHGLGTLLANIIGCISLAIILCFFSQSNELFFVVGFCGSLTTFSTFCFEIYEKIMMKQYQSLIYYCVVTFIFGVILFWWIA